MKKLIIVSMSLVIGISGVELVNRFLSLEDKSNNIKVEPILYNRIGGITTISNLVDNYMVLLLSDNRVRDEFALELSDRNKVSNLRNFWIDQICALAGGPCSYINIKEDGWNWGIQINAKTALIFKEILETSISEMNINYKEKNELLTSLGGLKRQIVSQ